MILVGICGASGSGKSTLAREIKEALYADCTIIGQDCYYRNHAQLPFEDRCRLNYDEPEIFDHTEMYEDILALSRGESVTRKGYDYANHIRDDSEELIAPPAVLIVEGIHMFYDPAIRDLMDLKIYMRVDVDVCLLRRIGRDIKSRGRTIDNISRQYLDTVKPMYEKYISRYIDDADFAVMRGGKNRLAVDVITAYLNSQLEK